MPVIKALPALEIILGLKGVLDFYYWRGIPCVRKWPVIPPSSRTPASLASAALFGEIIRGYALLGPTVKALFQEAAADQPRTARDIYVSAVLGRLHEVDVATDNQLLVLIEAHTFALTALANALQSVATDRLIVRGEDQLFSIKNVITATKNATASYANFHIRSNPVPADELWLITNITSVDNTRATTYHYLYNFHAGGIYRFYTGPATHAQYIPSVWQGQILFAPGDSIGTEIRGSANGDGLSLSYFGFSITLET